MDNITELQSEVKMAREALFIATTRLNHEEETFAQHVAPLRADLELRKQDVAQAEEKLKAFSVAEYRRTGVKKLSEYVMVKLFKKPPVYDQSDALDWCRTNMPVAIVETVDKNLFEKYPGVTDLPFVTQPEDEPRATIAKEL